ncbi:MAG: MFS transporter [Candidatus Binatia bacterium]|nr:MFS transporter [Candidatus Binatia bacterium]
MSDSVRGSKRAYAVWGVSALFVVYQFVLQVSAGVLADDMERDFGIGAAGVGLLTGLFSIAYAATQIPVGLLLDRGSPRRLMTASCLVCSAGTLVFGLAPTATVAGVGRLAMGLGASFAFVGTGFLAARWLPVARFAFFVGLAEMAGMLGAAFGAGGLAALLDVMSWRTLMHGAGAFGVVLAVVLWVVVRDAPESTGDPAGEAESPPMGRALSQLTGTPQVWVIASFYALSLGVLLGMAGLWDIPFLQTFGRNLPAAAAANSWIFLGMAAGAPLAGWISDRLARRRIVIQLSIVVTFVFLALILYTPKLPLPLVWTLMFGFGLGSGGNILAFAVATENASQESRGAVMGVVNTFGFLGVTVLQFLPGFWMGDTLPPGAREFAGALTVFPASLVLAFCLSFLIRETHPARG